MGQGHYVSVVYGISLADEARRKALETTSCDWVWDDMMIPREQRLDWREAPSTSYEASTPYVGYRIAASSGMASASDGEVDLNDLGCMRLADLPAAVEKHSAKARARWAKFAEWMKGRGIDLPAPELLWVADYD